MEVKGHGDFPPGPAFVRSDFPEAERGRMGQPGPGSGPGWAAQLLRDLGLAFLIGRMGRSDDFSSGVDGTVGRWCTRSRRPPRAAEGCCDKRRGSESFPFFSSFLTVLAFCLIFRVFSSLAL